MSDLVQEGADFSSHHIEGYARAAIERGQDGHFSCPLISEVLPNLWVGGCKDGVKLPDDFDLVVSLYKWEKYELGPDTERVEIEMYDAGNLPDPKQLNDIADLVNLMREYDNKVLVHCQAGLNRSNLVTALALIKSGYSPEDAIALLRAKRSPMVLCNEAFESWLLHQGDTDEHADQSVPDAD